MTQPTTGTATPMVGMGTVGTGTVGTGERTRYFPGQLVGADDLTQDQAYAAERRRRHNRLLHGWGVVAGAGVTIGTDPGTVVVSTGFVLGPDGEEIWIGDDVVVDLCHVDAAGNLLMRPAAAGSSELSWTTSVAVQRSPGETVHLGVRYAEHRTRPVRVPGSMCGCDQGGCDQGGCEFSRVADAYAFAGLSSLPDGYAPMAPPDTLDLFGGGPAVTPLPAPLRDAWVVLADVVMAGATQVDSLDLYARRRHVAAYGFYYFLNSPQLSSVSIPATVAAGSPVPVTLTFDAPLQQMSYFGVSVEPAVLQLPSPGPSAPAGARSATFQLGSAGITAQTQVTVIVSLGSSTQSAQTTVTA